VGVYDFTEGAADVGSTAYEDRLRFAKEILANLDAPETAGNVHFLLAWMAKENVGSLRPGWVGGVSEVGSGFNPFATTRNLDDEDEAGDRPIGGDPTQNRGNPVMEYATWERGIRATLETLNLGYYVNLVAALREGTDLDKVLADPAVLGELQTWGSINAANPQFGTRTGYSYEGLMESGIAGAQPSLGLPGDVPGVPADDGSLDFRQMLLDMFPGLAALSGEEFEAAYQNALDIVAEHGLAGLEEAADFGGGLEPAEPSEPAAPARPVYDGDSPSGIAIFNALLDHP